MLTRSEHIERAMAEALDAARAKARVEGRQPTVEEFAAAINGVGEPPKRKRTKRPKRDERATEFWYWLYKDHDHEYYLNKIREMPGGLDISYLAQVIANGESFYIKEEECREALEMHREAIALIESVLAEVEKQKLGKVRKPND